jgi:hypothetical protein
LALKGGEWSASRPVPLPSTEKRPVTVELETGHVQESTSQFGEEKNPSPLIKIQHDLSDAHPVTFSLYRPNYPGFIINNSHTLRKAVVKTM